MIALSVRQPYASMIAGLIPQHLKTIETRTRRTHHRGPLLICAGRLVTQAPSHYTGPSPETLPRGVAICIVNLIDCRPMRPEDWEAAQCSPYPDAWAWVLEDIQTVQQLPVRGQQQIFNVDLDALKKQHKKRAKTLPGLFSRSR
jgi:hypothetical protein